MVEPKEWTDDSSSSTSSSSVSPPEVGLFQVNVMGFANMLMCLLSSMKEGIC